MTGAAGCVGHYVVEALLEDPGNQLHLLLRDPGKLRADLLLRATVHIGDLAKPETFLPLLQDMDAAILLATAWGGDEARQVNVFSTQAILRALDPARCKRVVYFSTASLLDPHGEPLKAAKDHGTGYILQKLEALETLAGNQLGDKVVPIFPTVVLGGDERHPYSHASNGLLGMLRYMGLLRWVDLNGRFHVVHAHDVARAVAHLLEDEPPRRPVILGNPALSVREAIGELARFCGYKATTPFDLTAMVLKLPALLPRAFTSWDRYCLTQRDFSLPILDLPALLGRSGFETLTGILDADPRLRDFRRGSAAAIAPQPSRS